MNSRDQIRNAKWLLCIKTYRLGDMSELWKQGKLYKITCRNNNKFRLSAEGGMFTDSSWSSSIDEWEYSLKKYFRVFI